MSVLSGLTASAGLGIAPGVPPVKQSPSLAPSGGGLTHVYTSGTKIIAGGEPDWVYLSAVLYAEQIHPATLEDLDAMDVRDLERWSIEGPTSLRPGETPNCSLTLDMAYSLTTTPGTDWREFRPGEYKLRSYILRLTITRPTTDYDFRVYRLATRATRKAKPMRETFHERFFNLG
jgi:hypothetical protein